MDYFEVGRPSGDGLCSDNACPCPNTVIPRGSGYVFITQDVVDFRRRYPKSQDAIRAYQKYLEQMFGERTFAGNVPGPILVCELGARRRNLNLEIAAADARHWWKTGFVPLRATPTV